MSNTVPAAPPPATPLSGEAIRLMNYVDDVSTTLRRVLALAPTLTADERKRLSDYLKNSAKRRYRPRGARRQVAQVNRV